MVQGTEQVLVFEIAGHRLGVPGGWVRELVRAVLVTTVPGSPRFVEGVINLRGTMVPVLDLRQWLGLAARPIEPADYLLVLSWEGRLVALRVDRAVELACASADEMKPADVLPGSQTKVQVANLSERLVLLPELDTLLAHGVSGNFAGTPAPVPQGEQRA